MLILGKSELLAARRPAPVPVELPELGGGVYVRTLTARELEEYLAGSVTVEHGEVSPNLVGQRARLVCLCCCDENGTLLFDEGNEGQVSDMPAPILERIYERAQEVNGLGAGAMERARKD